MKGFFLIAVAVVAVGIFVLPSTVSFFAEQHNWYDLSPPAHKPKIWGRNDVPCEKCHTDVEGQMQSPENGAHRDLTCADCHRAPFTEYNYARGNYIYATKWQGTKPGKEAHAASVVACTDCHTAKGGAMHPLDPEYVTRCNDCHHSPPKEIEDKWKWMIAGGFGLTGRTNDTGEKEAHEKFLHDAIENASLKGSNEACVACHTATSVTVTYLVPQGYKIKSSRKWEGDEACGEWEVNFSYCNFTRVEGASGGASGDD